ncbi:hypothetical protein [Variovorax sp. WS11]|uniref:hypothetical protein n=1 Tax=Variovorax sp. WS11 TaxID=1105204 RepID=UPI001EF2405D|nr:hypothetical protein [Variovorax sp. WS11]
MPPRPMAQTVLFDDAEEQPLPQLPQDVQIHLLQQMVQWMRVVAVAINKGERDEQDHR